MKGTSLTPKKAAEHIWQLGANVTAIANGSKKPTHLWETWQTERQTIDVLNGIFWRGKRSYNGSKPVPPAVTIGVISGVNDYRVFDVDPRKDDQGNKLPVPERVVLALLQALDLPEDYAWYGRSGSGCGWHVWVRCGGTLPDELASAGKSRQEAGVKVGAALAEYATDFDHVELRWERCQTVLPTPSGYSDTLPDDAPTLVDMERLVGAFFTVAHIPVKEAPAPPVAPANDQATRRNGNREQHYIEAAIRGKLNDAIEHVRNAPDGQRHETRYAMARYMGGLLHYGYFTEDDIVQALYDARVPGANHETERQTIRDGVAQGKGEEITIPVPEPTSNGTHHPPRGQLAARPEPTSTLEEPEALRAALDTQVASNGYHAEEPVPSAPREIYVPDSSSFPPLPDSAHLPTSLSAQASPWLDEYIAFSRHWSPRSYDHFHEAAGLWLLATVAARRLVLHEGRPRYPSLYIALCARTSLFAKSSAVDIAISLLSQTGLLHLTAPDDATPQAFVRMLTHRVPDNFDDLTPDRQEYITLRLAFAGQRGWFFDEFGLKLNAMMRDGGFMADFRGLLRKFDDQPEQYEYETIGRGGDMVQRPYISLLANLTPADLAPFARKGAALWNDGFFARMGFVAPPGSAYISDAPFPSGARHTPHTLVSTLRAMHDRLGVPDVELKQRFGRDGKPDGYTAIVEPVAPARIDWTLEARTAYYRYDLALLDLMRNREALDIDGNYKRLPEKALRIAMLLAGIEGGSTIELRHWARAQEIAERWRRDLHNLIDQLQHVSEATAERTIEDKIVAVLKRNEPNALTARDIHRAIRELGSGEAHHYLTRMEQAGTVQAEKRGKTVRYSLIPDTSVLIHHLSTCQHVDLSLINNFVDRSSEESPGGSVNRDSGILTDRHVDMLTDGRLSHRKAANDPPLTGELSGQNPRHPLHLIRTDMQTAREDGQNTDESGDSLGGEQ